VHGVGDLRNIELKARLGDLESARRAAHEIATQRGGVQEQVDTYFLCRHGRLKLRQIDNLSAQLVCYARPDRPQPKPSDYQLVPIANPETLKSALTAALGVRCVVRKRREIFLYHNVRIHLDQVAELGPFLEFEAVLGPGVDDAAGQAQLDELTAKFALQPANLVSGSYADMIG